MNLTRPNICPIEGNPDLYGLGIRLGIYFQLISTSLTSRLLPEEMLGTWDTNSIFLLAIFAAVSKSTISGAIQYAEAYVMLQLMFAFLICAFPKGLGALVSSTLRGITLGFSQKDKELLKTNLGLSILGNQWRQALAAAVACYNVWFWFRFEPSGDCEAYIFLFARVPASSEAHGFYRAFAVLYLTYQAIKYLIFAAILTYNSSKAKQFSFASIWKLYLSASQLDREEPEHILTLQEVDKRKDNQFWPRVLLARGLIYWKVLSIVTSLLLVAWFVLAIELSLRWNYVIGIYDIGSTGQLIPFIIGLLGLLRVIHVIVRSTDEDGTSEKPNGKNSIEVDKSSAVWRYHLRDGRYVTFNVNRVSKRRYSFNGQDTAPGTIPEIKRPLTTEERDHLDPVFPVLKDWSAMSLFKETFRTSEQLERFSRKPTILFNTALWQYPVGDGRIQNFNAGCWPRRWSYDGRFDRKTLLPFVTNDATFSPEDSKNGKLLRASHHIVNGLKYYINKFIQSQNNRPHQNKNAVSTTAPAQTEHLLSNGSKLIFLDPEEGRNEHQPRSSRRRWSLNDASQAENRAIIEPRDQPTDTDTDTSSTQSPLPESRSIRFFVRFERILSSAFMFFLIELGVPLAKLLCLPCRLHRRAKAKKVKRQREKHQEIIRQLVERLEPSVEEWGEREMPLEFRMWEYALDELDEIEGKKYESTPYMLWKWVEGFLRWRGYRV